VTPTTASAPTSASPAPATCPAEPTPETLTPSLDAPATNPTGEPLPGDAACTPLVRDPADPA
jgi:hypothetical protein